MTSNDIQLTSNFFTIYLSTYQSILPLYFFQILIHSTLHLITISLSNNLMHNLKWHPINFKLFHNIFIHLPIIFTTLLFLNIYLFYLALNNNIILLFIL